MCDVAAVQPAARCTQRRRDWQSLVTWGVEADDSINRRSEASAHKHTRTHIKNDDLENKKTRYYREYTNDARRQTVVYSQIVVNIKKTFAETLLLV